MWDIPKLYLSYIWVDRLMMPSKVPSPVSEQPRRADTPSPIEHRRRDRGINGLPVLKWSNIATEYGGFMEVSQKFPEWMVYKGKSY